MSDQNLCRWVRSGRLRKLLRGVFVAADVPDSLRLRVAALRCVVPGHGVVTDRTAAWLHGVDVLPRSAIHEMPALDVYSVEQSRVRRGGVRSGLRNLRRRDIQEVDGLLVTTPLRTALDLGRLLSRYDAMGALDAFVRAGVDRTRIEAEVERFKGFRGVRQLRELAPLASPLAESMPESALRLHCIDAGLEDIKPQVWVADDAGVQHFRIDVGDEHVRYGAEYFGEEFHGDDQEPADTARLEWLDEHRDWVIDVLRKDDLYGQGAEPSAILRAGWARAQMRSARRATPTVIDLRRRV